MRTSQMRTFDGIRLTARRELVERTRRDRSFLISTLVTSNVVGEASRIGFGSALATIMLVISLVFITIFLSTVMRGEQR